MSYPNVFNKHSYVPRLQFFCSVSPLNINKKSYQQFLLKEKMSVLLQYVYLRCTWCEEVLESDAGSFVSVLVNVRGGNSGEKISANHCFHIMHNS